MPGKSSQISRRDVAGTAALGGISFWRGRSASSAPTTACGSPSAAFAAAAWITSRSYSKHPNVEIAAVCDIDENVAAQAPRHRSRRCRQPKPEDLRRYPQAARRQIIDAISIATPNHWHALMAIWALPGGQGRLRREAVLAQFLEGRQLVQAAQQVQPHGAARHAEPLGGGDPRRHPEVHDGYLARSTWRAALFQVARHHRPHAGEPVPAGVITTCGPGPRRCGRSRKNRFHYNWHWYWDLRQRRYGQPGRPPDRYGALGLGREFPNKVRAIGGHFMFDDDQKRPTTCLRLRVQPAGRQAADDLVRSAALDDESRKRASARPT